MKRAIRRRPWATALLLTVMVSLLPGAVISDRLAGAAPRVQDATDASSAVCAVPQPVAGTPEASPAAVAAASPVAGGDATDPATAAEIERLVRALAACLTQGRAQTVIQLVTERYLGAQYGGGGRLAREDYLALAPDLPAISVAISSVTNIRSPREGRATADVVSVVGNQLVYGRWSFVRQGDTDEATGLRAWLADTIAPLPVEPPVDATRVRVTLTEYAFELSRGRTGNPSVVFTGTNAGDEDHELLVLSMERGVSTDSLLREPGPGLPDGVAFVGQVTVPAGQSADLVLVGLPKGSYALVCLIPDADGIPHLGLGQRARFRIE